MASIQLTRYEAEEDDLPDVCMRCGDPATERRRIRFTSHPFWIYVFLLCGILPYVVLAVVLTERARCHIHFCPQHKNHWRVRAFAVWGTLVAIMAIIPIYFGGNHLAESQLGLWDESTKDILVGIGFVVVPTLVFCWLISIPIIQLTAIYISNVTERTLTLRSVSQEFVDAVLDYRKKREDEDEQEDPRGKFRIRRRPGPRQDIYDPER